MPKGRAQDLMQLLWQGRLSDYVTAIAWTPDGDRVVACSAAGEVVLYDAKTGTPTVLQSTQESAVNALSISSDGKFLAFAGQAGTVVIWQLEEDSPQVLTQLTYPQVWIDRLQWHPCYPELAFSFGRHVQVWEASSQTVSTTLNFEASTVLDLAWHPQGEYLSASGNQSVKTWQRQNWEADPVLRETECASVAIAWSPNGIYLASGNNDRSLLVWEQGIPYPWQMQGFPAKVRQLAWSKPVTAGGVPILASISADGIVIWRKDPDPSVGWAAQLLDQHQGKVSAIAFQPDSCMLASAAEDGWVCLWTQAHRLVQILQGAPNGFSTLAWNWQGTLLATAGQQGEILVWKQKLRGIGFG